MKRLLIVNDTGSNKNTGCQATMFCFKALLEKYYSEWDIDYLGVEYTNFKYSKTIQRRAFPNDALTLRETRTKFLSDAFTDLNPVVEAIKRADKILVNGEGSFLEQQRNALFLYAVCDAAISLKKEVHLMNFTAHITKPLPSKLAREIFNKVTSVSVREPLSYKILQELGIRQAKLFPDIVIGLRQILKLKRKEKHLSTNPPIALLGGSSATLRIFKNTPESQTNEDETPYDGRERCLHLFRQLAKGLTQNGFNVKCLAFPKDEWMRGLVELPKVEYYEPTFETYFRLASEASVNITGRHHGVVIGAAARCPFISFTANCFKNYGNKMLYSSPSAIHRFDKFDPNKVIESSVHCRNQNYLSEYTDLIDQIEQHADGGFKNTLKPEPDLIDTGCIPLECLEPLDFSENTIP